MTLAEGREMFKEARGAIRKVFVGYDDLVTCMFLCMLTVGNNTTGHLLIIGKTGTGKTRLSTLIARIFGLDSHRIDGMGEQLPSDIIGYEDIRTNEIVFGPVCTNLLHADEFNRFSPRTRAALLAPMAEGVITIKDTTFKLDPPFIVIATENPTSYGDAAPLRPQERDRFLLSFFLDWPSLEEQVEIIGINLKPPSFDFGLSQLCSRDDLLLLQKEIAEGIYVDPSIWRYGALISRQLVPRFSDIPEIKSGETLRDASIVRGGNDLVLAARSYAFFEGSQGVEPRHIEWVAPFALAHRMDAYTQELSRRQRRSFIERAWKEARKQMGAPRRADDNAV